MKREITTLKAVFNHALAEMDLPGDLRNPFKSLKLAGQRRAVAQEVDGKLRNPFPTQLATNVLARLDQVSGSRRPELAIVWRLLEGTGCRLGEIVGLRVADVYLECECPYLDIRPNSERQLKSQSSVRRVPLMDEALDAAHAAVRTSAGAEYLFPNYVFGRGADRASKALMKHVRAVTEDRKLTVHSLRHSMKDDLRIAGATKEDQDALLGHARRDVGDRFYGGPEGQLVAARRALKAALQVRSTGSGEHEND